MGLITPLVLGRSTTLIQDEIFDQLTDGLTFGANIHVFEWMIPTNFG